MGRFKPIFLSLPFTLPCGLGFFGFKRTIRLPCGMPFNLGLVYVSSLIQVMHDLVGDSR